MLILIALMPWVVLVGLAGASLVRRPRLRSYAPAGAGPRVSVVVPARDEAGNIGVCLATLAHSQYANREIIVVDDQSVDGTADIVRALMERSQGDIRLVEGEPLPHGWLGKPWACWQGYRAARGELLLFTDADTRHEADLLGRAVAALETERADLVTVVPEQELASFWERMIMPQILFMLGLRFRATRMNRTGNPRDVVANGQFILIRRDTYEAIGGHEAIRGEVVEDLRLAQRTVEAGRRLFAAHAEEMMQTRMYRSLGGLVEGWSKNVALGARQSVAPWLRPIVPWLLVAFLVCTWIAPPVLLIGAAVTGGASDVLLWSLSATILSLTFWLIMNVRLGVPSLYSLVFPIGALAAAAIVTRSALRGRRVAWRGREYVVEES